MEFLILMALSYAAAVGIEKITDDTKAAAAERAAKRAARNPGGMNRAPSISPLMSTLGTKAASAAAAGIVNGRNWRDAFLSAYRENYPQAVEQRVRRLRERAEEIKAEAARTAPAGTGEAQVAPVIIIERSADPAPETDPAPAPETDPELVILTKAPRPAPAPTTAPDPVPFTEPAPFPRPPTDPAVPDDRDDYDDGDDDGDDADPAPQERPNLTIVPTPRPKHPGDPMSPTTMIPEIRTLDGLLSALRVVREMCLMRAEEARALASGDLALADQLDTAAAELAVLDVDPKTLAEVAELRDSLRSQAEVSMAYATSTEEAAELAKAVADAATKNHSGIAEAVQSAPIDQAAQAGYYNR